MSDTENMMSALAGQDNGPVDATGEDWKSKYDDLQRKFQTNKVEEGRLRKVNEALEAANKRIAELEGRSRMQEVTADIPAEIGEDIPDAYKDASAMIAMRAVEKSGISERLDSLEKRARTDAQSAFMDRVNAQFPGFLSGIESGGDKHAAWNEYLRYNSASVKDAIDRGDYSTLVYHINTFYTGTLGVPAPSGMGNGAATPDPNAIHGGSAVDIKPGKTYTQTEILALYDKVEAARDRGDYGEVRRIGDEIEKAQREGRVR